MATHPDVLQLVAILDEEGFGVIAGELLAEINLGRELESPRDYQDSAPSDEPEADIVREPIPDDEQLGEATAFLRRRLVEPARAFAEAERLAGSLSEQLAVGISFIDPQSEEVIQPALARDLGDASVAEKLDRVLARLPNLVGPRSSLDD